jgi:hypothetical protein
MGGTLMRLAGIGKREDAVDRDADRTVVEQRCELRQLRTARAHLRRRDREAARLGLFAAGGAETEDREERAAALERDAPSKAVSDLSRLSRKGDMSDSTSSVGERDPIRETQIALLASRNPPLVV